MPADADGSRAIFAKARRHYTAISIGSDGRAICFSGRFGAVVMDKPHLLAAAGYIALNPMVAGLMNRSSLAIVEHSGAARGRG